MAAAGVRAAPRRRSLWRRFRRATRGPRNAVLARAIWGTGRFVGALPLPLALAIGRALGLGAHRLLGAPRRLAHEHLAFAFPELAAAARAQLVRDVFVHAGQSFFELAAWPRLRDRPEYVELDGGEVLASALEHGRGAIAVSGHVGNWELLAATVSARGFPLTVVARRVNDERFNALIVRFRREAGTEVLLREEPQFLDAVRDALRRNRIVAILIDQDTRGAGVFVPFFGRPARTPAGAAVLGLRVRVPIVTAFIQRRCGGGHRIEIRPVDVGSERGRRSTIALTATLTAAVEAYVRRAPAEWVWWHERWRRQPDR
jgi:KDO2-lipid IV(A) lauroyltransferase